MRVCFMVARHRSGHHATLRVKTALDCTERRVFGRRNHAGVDLCTNTDAAHDRSKRAAPERRSAESRRSFELPAVEKLCKSTCSPSRSSSARNIRMTAARALSALPRDTMPSRPKHSFVCFDTQCTLEGDDGRENSRGGG